MKYALGNMLNGAGGLNADQLALDLPFAVTKSLTAAKGPTPTFTRASSGTFVGSNGLIQSAGTNVARFDHTAAGVCRGLLIEESRTNTALYSDALVNGTGWTSVGTTSVVDGVGPDGNNAYEIAETAGGTLHTFFNTGGTGSTQAASVTSGTTYTSSIFLKKISGSVDWVQVTLASVGFGTSQYANINLSNGTVGNSSGGTARVEAYANGWYRVSWSASATTTTSSTGTILVAGINNTNGTTRVPSYSGSTANKFLATMAQFETGSFATSYIPTVASSVVRSADVCSISGAEFTGMWNTLEGSLFTSAIFNAPITYGLGQRLVDVNDGTINNSLRYFRNSATGTAALVNTSANNTDVLITSASAIQSSTANKYSAGFKANDFVFYINNSQIGTDVVNAMPVSPTTFTIGDTNAASGTRLYTNGTISAIRYYRKRLDNSKLASLTV
jgi:hypothetical protein